MGKTLIPVLMLIVTLSFQSQAQVTKIWAKEAIASNPESIVYDNTRNCCYVSNFGKSPSNGMNYNEDYISSFNLDGELLEKKFVPNLTAPTGLCLFNDILYIVERFGVVKFDLKKNKVETRYRINSTRFLNDVTVDSDENIYVTVSDTNIIYRISNGKVEKWVEGSQFSKSNGILCDGDRIIVGVCSDNAIRAVSIADRKITEIVKMGTGSGVIDGLRKYGSDYLVSHYEGIVYLLRNDGSFKEILNTAKEGVSCADFEFIETRNLLVIPTLKNNIVSLYRFQDTK